MFSPSKEALEHLGAISSKTVDIESWRPFDLPGCECEGPIKAMEYKMGTLKLPPEHITCPKAKDKDFKKYKVVCGACNCVLAKFRGRTASFKTEYCDLHYVNGYNKDTWYGTQGLNRNRYTMEVNFECYCGNKIIIEQNDVMDLTTKQVSRNVPRYTTHKIKPDKS